MHFYADIKKQKLRNLKIADHVLLGFNAFFLIEVLYEAITEKYNATETQELVELINIHYQHGIGLIAVDYQQMICDEVKDKLLADYIIDLYELYKECVQFLLAHHKTNLKSIVNYYKQLYYNPDEELCFMDYMQAHRWFVTAIKYNQQKMTKVDCYKYLRRYDSESEVIEVLTMSEVERLAEVIYNEFNALAEKRMMRRNKTKDIESSIKKTNSMYHG